MRFKFDLHSSQFQYFNCTQIIGNTTNNLDNLLTQLILPHTQKCGNREVLFKKQTNKNNDKKPFSFSTNTCSVKGNGGGEERKMAA